MRDDFDTIVIGGGAGGATLAHACATSGKSVLLIERGAKRAMVAGGEINGELGGQGAATPPSHDEQATLIEKRPYDDRSVQVNGSPRRLYMGGVLGGGTSLYGALLLRPSPDDFHPGKHYGSRIPRSDWDWPIDYETLSPFYDKAEALFQIAASGDDDFGPLPAPRRDATLETLPLTPANRRLLESNRARGLKPFRLPLAIEAASCLRCDHCAGFPCPTGARRSAAQLVEQAMAGGAPLHLLERVEVERLERSAGGAVAGIHVVDRATGKRDVYRAKRYVLAAGAIGSAALLLRSGFENSQIGRNYMMHLSPVVIGLFPGATGADETFIKQVGFADYYFGAKHFPHKIGLIQSLPAPGPLMFSKAALKRTPASVFRFLRRRMLPLAGIVEDLPDPNNRVSLDGDGNICLQHRFHPYDFERGRWLRTWMKEILRRAGAWICAAKVFPSYDHVAHQCGTLRFGADPKSAVADADGRVYGYANLFVADGSVFPTSLGVGPALTIVANALRVSRIVAREC